MSACSYPVPRHPEQRPDAHKVAASLALFPELARRVMACVPHHDLLHLLSHLPPWLRPYLVEGRLDRHDAPPPPLADARAPPLAQLGCLLEPSGRPELHVVRHLQRPPDLPATARDLASVLLPVLPELPELQALNLSHAATAFDDDAIAALASAVPCLQHVQMLALNGVHIRAQDSLVAQLGASMAELPELRALHLRSIEPLAMQGHWPRHATPAGLAGASAPSALGAGAAEAQLGLDAARQPPRPAWALLPPLAALTALTTLDVSMNPLGTEGARALADALAGLSALRALVAFQTQLGCVGGKALAAALPALQALERLDLANCELRLFGTAPIADALCTLTQLTDLDLSQNSMCKSAAPVLERTLRHLPNLQQLSLAGNGLLDVGLAKLVTAWPALPRLRMLDTSGNDTTAALEAQVLGLSCLESLEKLAVGLRGVCATSLPALAAAVCSLPALRELSVQDTPLRGPDRECLQALLADTQRHVHVLVAGSDDAAGNRPDGAPVLDDYMDDLAADWFDLYDDCGWDVAFDRLESSSDDCDAAWLDDAGIACEEDCW